MREYKVETINLTPVSMYANKNMEYIDSKVQELLDRYSLNGYKLVQVMQYENSAYMTFYFEKEKDIINKI